MSSKDGFKYNLRITNRFKKHLKQIAKRNIDNVKKINDVVNSLQKGETLEAKFKDHALVGNWTGHRECHILPDLLLIYKIEENILILELVDTGTHADLFGK
jgi:mRNA interferase YafQ